MGLGGLEVVEKPADEAGMERGGAGERDLAAPGVEVVGRDADHVRPPSGWAVTVTRASRWPVVVVRERWTAQTVCREGVAVQTLGVEPEVGGGVAWVRRPGGAREDAGQEVVSERVGGGLVADGVGAVADAPADVLGHPAGVAGGVRVGLGPVVDRLSRPFVGGFVGQDAAGVEGGGVGRVVEVRGPAGAFGDGRGELAEGVGGVTGEEDGLGVVVDDGEEGADGLGVADV